jgi:hypothetical protein
MFTHKLDRELMEANRACLCPDRTVTQRVAVLEHELENLKIKFKNLK